MRAMTCGLALLSLLLISPLLPAAAQTADCQKPIGKPTLEIPMPGRPFSAISSRDGCTIFVSLFGGGAKEPGRIIVLSRTGGAVAIAHDLHAEGHLGGMSLSPDGKYLVASNGVGVTLFSVERLRAGDEKPLGYLNDAANAESIYTLFSPDGRLIFVSDESARSVTVHDFAALLGGQGDRIIGRIATGNAPVGLAASPDGRLLYSTSQVDTDTTSQECRPEGGQGANHAQGRLLVIDLQRAATAPAEAVLARVPAGCNPVRVALSPDGARVYVTARGENALLVFDAAKLLSDSKSALLQKVDVGASPVGVAATARNIFVANSGRFGSQDQTVAVLAAANPAAPAVTIPAGKFPRELLVTPDGDTLLVTNFGSQTLELVDLTQIPSR